MERAELLAQLDKATDMAARLVTMEPLKIKSPHPKKSYVIGKTVIEKNNKGLYDITDVTSAVLYKDIYVLDVAIIIAQRFNSKEFKAIEKVLRLEDKFAKHHTDMTHYLQCYKGARAKHDIEKMHVLEDKFQTAEQMARLAKNNISIFKRVK